MQARSKEPILNVEDPAPFWLAAVLVLCYVGFSFAPSGFKNFILSAAMLLAQQGHVMLDGRPLGNVSTLLTHTLIHSGWSHVLVNAGLILAFGVFTVRATKNMHIPVWGRFRRGALVFLTIFLAGAIMGGLAQWLLWIVTQSSGAALGASTGGAALFATTGWAMGGKNRLIIFGIIMLAYDMFVIATSGMTGGMLNPAWAGHLGGFLAGAVLAPLLVTPGAARLGG